MADVISSPSKRTSPQALSQSRPAEYGAHWDSATGLLLVRMTGVPDERDVVRWEAAVQEALAGIPADTRIRVLVDLRGYEVADVPWAVHRRQREVVPRFLLKLGHRAGYLTILDAPPAPDPSPGRVVAVAHVHHDRDKMDLYQMALSRRNERYFTAPAEALEWMFRVPEAVAH